MLTLKAPAKINLTLEVLGKRTDGFHEIRSVLQTIDLSILKLGGVFPSNAIFRTGRRKRAS
jgi:hypothetical protein